MAGFPDNGGPEDGQLVGIHEFDCKTSVGAQLR